MRGGGVLPLFLLSEYKGVEVMLSITTKSEYDELIEQIGELIKEYEENNLYHNEYQFYLASGPTLKFTFGEQNIGHLLGINLDYLRATNLFKNKDAYSLLKEFLENSYTVYRQVQAGRMSFKSIFSDYITDKLEIFKTVSTYFSPDDIELVCQYDKSKIYQSGDEQDYPCDYFIVKKNNKGDLFVLGLIDKGTVCFPMTSMLFQNDEKQTEKLKRLLQNQTITYVNTIDISNPVTKFENKNHVNLLQSAKKIANLKTYRNMIAGVAIDSAYQHQYIINGYLQKQEQLKLYKNLFEQLKTKMLAQEFFELDQLDQEVRACLDPEWIELIQTYNDQLCVNTSSKTVQETYTNLLNGHLELSSEIEDLKEQLKQSKTKQEQLLQQVAQLQVQNAAYENFQSQIFEVVEKQKKK